jgi:hypothetical protein
VELHLEVLAIPLHKVGQLFRVEACRPPDEYTTPFVGKKSMIISNDQPHTLVTILITLAGTPPTTLPDSTSHVTTAPAARMLLV